MKKDDAKSFISKSFVIHGDDYSYENVEYFNSRSKVSITCKKHGDFLVTPSSFLQGKGCPKCKREKQSSNTSEFIEKAKKIHGEKYNYENVDYVNSYTKVKINCPKHGDFYQKPKVHLAGRGCRKCGIESSAKSHLSTRKTYIKKSKQIHGDFYDYGDYYGIEKDIELVCPTHGKFTVNAKSHLRGQRCPKCSSVTTNYQQKLIDDLNGLIEFSVNDRSVLPNNLELDFYFPEKKFAVEINGVYWHSSIFKHKNYHDEKFFLAENKGINLLQVWDVDLRDNYGLVLSMIKNKLGLADKKIPARKTKIKLVDSKTYKEFLSKNHLQGYAPSKVKVGLFFDNELVSVAGFTERSGEWILDRFCSLLHTVVIGGFSKILKYFEKTYDPKVIITFSDNRYSDGGLYRINGFDLVKTNGPRLYYTDKVNIFNRRNFQKPALKKSYPFVYNDEDSEKVIAEKLGFYQLWGPGTKKWRKIKWL